MFGKSLCFSLSRNYTTFFFLTSFCYSVVIKILYLFYSKKKQVIITAIDNCFANKITYFLSTFLDSVIFIVTILQNRNLDRYKRGGEETLHLSPRQKPPYLQLVSLILNIYQNKTRFILGYIQ